MWKLLLIALLFSLPAAAQSVALGETLCTTDSLAIAPINDNLREGSHTVTVNWASDSNTLWYRLYRGSASGGPYTRIADCLFGTSYVDVVAPSQTLYYVLTAVNASGESGNSGQGTALVPLFDTVTGFFAQPTAVQINESLSTADALLPISAQMVTLAETLSISDSVATAHTSGLTLSETLSTSDLFSPGAAFKLTLGENLSTVDASSANYRATVSLGESLTTLDGLNTSFTGGINLAETLSTSDVISPTATAHNAAPQESLATSDSFSSASNTFQYALAENLTTLDALTLTVTLPGTKLNGTAIYALGNYGIAPAGACAFTLQIMGRRFAALSSVTFNGAVRATTYVSPQVLQVALLRGDLAAAGTYPVIVWMGGYATAAKYFDVIPPTPTISGARLAGGALIVDGDNFVPGGPVPLTTVFWNGQPLPTSWISPTRLQAQIPAKSSALGAVAVSVADVGCFAN